MPVRKGNVLKAHLPADLVERLDETGARIERTRSWIIRQALGDWLAEEARRLELTKEGRRDIDEGVSDHEAVLAPVASKKAQPGKPD